MATNNLSVTAMNAGNASVEGGASVVAASAGVNVTSDTACEGASAGTPGASAVLIKRQVVIFAAIIIVGSALCFYGSNLFMSDVANMFYAPINPDIISSFPFFMFTLDGIAAFVFFSRLCAHPERKKNLTITFTVVLSVFSLVGIVTSILTGLLIYKSFVTPWPFPCYALVCLVLNAVVLVGALVCCAKAQNLPSPKDVPQTKPLHKCACVLYSIVLGLLTFLVFNRFGSLLFSVTYVQMRTLWLTWPHYVSLTLPLMVLLYATALSLGAFCGKHRMAIALPFCILALNIALCVTCVSLGMTHTEFISAISPSLGLERLATLPINTGVMFCGVGISSLAFGIYAAVRVR